MQAGLEPAEALGAATWRGGDVLRDPHAGRLTTIMEIGPRSAG